MKVLTIMGKLALAVVALLVLVGGVLYVRGSSALSQTYEVDAAPDFTAAAPDSAVLARGAHLVATSGCRDCHGGDLSGQVFADAPPFLVPASNLTRGAGGIGELYTDADWNRAIRHGVRPDGSAMVIMPSKAYHKLSNDDTRALVAYLKRIPAVDNELPERQFRMPAYFLAGAGGLRLSDGVVTDAPAAEPTPPKDATATYGRYLASMTCTYCHGQQFEGMPNHEPSGPYVPALADAASWSTDQFIQTMRTGVRPAGDTLDVMYMPYSAFKNYDDTELTAIHRYIQDVTEASAQPTASM